MENLAKLLSEVLRIPAAEIEDKTSMEELDSWDSLRHMEIIQTIEQSYEIELTADEIVQMTNVGGIKEVLISKNLL